jgi:hypothetical protein
LAAEESSSLAELSGVRPTCRPCMAFEVRTSSCPELAQLGSPAGKSNSCTESLRSPERTQGTLLTLLQPLPTCNPCCPPPVCPTMSPAQSDCLCCCLSPQHLPHLYMLLAHTSVHVSLWPLSVCVCAVPSSLSVCVWGGVAGVGGAS